MGAGKTTVGRLLGRRRRVPFLDLDDLLVADPSSDESTFRAEERAAFRDRLGFDGVLSLGGGTLLDPASAALAWTFRKVVVLLPPDDVAAARARGKHLADQADRLLRERATAYRRRAFSVVPFDALASPDDVADAVEALLARP